MRLRISNWSRHTASRRITDGLVGLLAAIRLSTSTRPLAWRWGIGALVVLVGAIYVSAWIDSDLGGGDWWGLRVPQPLMLWSAGFVAGCIVRRWRAVLLALLPVVVAIPFGVQEDGGGWLGNPIPVAYYMAVLAPVCAAFIVMGVGITTAMRKFVRGRGSAPAPG